MKPDRPLIAAVASLTAGLGLIFGFCDGTVGINAGYPLTGSTLKISITTSGAAALLGPAFTLLGVVLMLVALVCALIAQFRRDKGPLKPERERDVFPNA